MRNLVIFSLACATGAFILSMMCLFAGSKPNFMEDYDIITLNTSTFGYAAIDASPTRYSAQPSAIPASSWYANVANTVTGDAGEVLGEIRNGVVNNVADKLGIQQWYSLHIMDMCMGKFLSDPFGDGPSKNVSRCSNMTAMYHFDLSTELNDQIASGPLAGQVNLTNLGYSEDILNGVDGLNTAISASFVLYCIGIAAAGFAMVTSFIALFVIGRLFCAFIFSLEVLSFLALGIASAVATGIMMKGSNLINKHGNAVGLYAIKGTKYMAITWSATGAMFLASLGWLTMFYLERRQAKAVAKAAELAEEKLAEEKPAEEKPAEEKPAEEKPAEEKPAAEA